MVGSFLILLAAVAQAPNPAIQTDPDRARSRQVRGAVADAKAKARAYREQQGVPAHVPRDYSFDEEAALLRPNLLLYSVGGGLQAFGGRSRALGVQVESGFRARWRDWALAANARYIYGESRSGKNRQVYANKLQLNARGERRVAGPLFGYLEGRGLQDRIAAVRWATSLGMGVTWLAFEQVEARFVRSALRFDLGYRLVLEDRHFYYPRSAAEDRQFSFAVPGFSFRYAPLQSIILDASLSAPIGMGTHAHQRIDGTLGAKAPLSQGLSIGLSYTYGYVEKPAKGVGQISHLTLAELNWVF